MATHERAGQPARTEDLVDVSHLVTAYFDLEPDPDDVTQQVAFGTSGHRGTSLNTSFNEVHIAATTQAICDYRREQGYDGPLFIGRDTHALSEPAWATALEVLVANDVTVLVDDRDGFTPTPAVSHAIIRANQGRTTGAGLADGIVVTPSHNPPQDGGFKYNPPHGGPADSDATRVIAARANELIRGNIEGVRRVAFAKARAAVGSYDFLGTYVDDLPNVLDLDVVRDAGVRIGADPLGGASVAYWGEIAERHRLDLTVVNPLVDPTWRFMTLDWDGKIRMDCSSPARDGLAGAAQGRVRHRHRQRRRRRPPRHRHPRRGPDEPQPLPRRRHRLPLRRRASGLAGHRAHRQDAGLELDDRPGGRLDRQAAGRGAGRLQVVRARACMDGSFGFGGEESAGASFLRRDGSTWTTDKDGLLLALLASEILGATGRTPSEHYADLVARTATRPTPASTPRPAARRRPSSPRCRPTT